MSSSTMQTFFYFLGLWKLKSMSLLSVAPSSSLVVRGPAAEIGGTYWDTVSCFSSSNLFSMASVCRSILSCWSNWTSKLTTEAIDLSTLVSKNDSNWVPNVHSSKQRIALAAAAFLP